MKLRPGDDKRIRESARGQLCQARIPFICNGNPATVVLAHMPGGTGKNEDAFGCYACSNCHDVIDGRVRTVFSRQEIGTMFLEGMVRTQRHLFEIGLLLTKRQADHNRRAQERGDYTHEDNAAG